MCLPFFNFSFLPPPRAHTHTIIGPGTPEKSPNRNWAPTTTTHGGRHLAQQVSWIRHRDIHILTVGSYTYTSDQRFQATHHKNTDDWTLQIKWAQKRDAGIYECQISTQPVRSYFVTLSVVGE